MCVLNPDRVKVDHCEVDCDSDVIVSDINNSKSNVETNVVLDELEHVMIEVQGLPSSLDAIKDSEAELSMG